MPKINILQKDTMNTLLRLCLVHRLYDEIFKFELLTFQK